MLYILLILCNVYISRAMNFRDRENTNTFAKSGKNEKAAQIRAQ